MFRASRRGFTLVELLVVIAIIGILVAILLPAIQAAREAGRRTQCINNLKNVGLGFINHHDVHKHFPTGGWGWEWTGDPDRGYGIQQPGGWLFNILPFMEDGDLRNRGKGQSVANKKTAATEVIQTPLAWAICPSRRRLAIFRNKFSGNLCKNCGTNIPEVARSDYSANCGDGDRNEFHAGPNDIAAATSFGWKTTNCPPGKLSTGDQMCGISFERSTVKMKDILDGTTHTYMVGEKYLNNVQYETGDDDSDNEHMYAGFDNDLFKSSSKEPAADGSVLDGSGRPVADPNRYGSSHPGNFHMAMVDGSVQKIPYDIDKSVHRRLGHRKDGQVLLGY